ncbi:MAG: sigma-70 family RNA polymerase sigma factor [Cyanobacteria bacterium J06648_16]
MAIVSTDLVKTYLEEIGQIPLLTHEEEIMLGKAVQTWQSLEEAKTSLEASVDPLTDRQWAELVGMDVDELRKAVSTGKHAHKRMLKSNLRLVVSIAKKYVNKTNIDFLDLIQEGSVGLDQGVRKFDPSKGYRFSTYAYWWIRQAITRVIASQGRTIRLPIHINEKLSKLRKAQRQAIQKTGRPAKIKDLAATLDETPERIRELLEYARRPLSLDMRMGEDRSTELSDLLEDEDAQTPEDYAIGQSLRDSLVRMLGDLTPKQRRVLELRYGLTDSADRMTLAKIGDILNISRERVRQLERQALRHLRKNGQELEGFLQSA